MAFAPSFARVLSEKRDNVASFDIESPRGDFTIQFTENKKGGQFWNICSSPPAPTRPLELELEHKGKASALWRTDCDGASEVAEEFDKVLEQYGGEDAVVYQMKTYHSPYIPSLKELFGDIKAILKDIGTMVLR